MLSCLLHQKIIVKANKSLLIRVAGGRGAPYNFGGPTKIGQCLDILDGGFVGEKTEDNGIPVLKLQERGEDKPCSATFVSHGYT